MIYEWQQGTYTISTDRQRLDIFEIHRFLTEESYWAKGRSLAAVQRSLNHSLCFGLYEQSGKQVGFVRVITDYTTFLYMADLFVLQKHRGRGLGKWLVQTALNHPELKVVPVWLLRTLDAHKLYEHFGFGPPSHPETLLQFGNYSLNGATKHN
jgi:GNAT superfamily N-acetyltransferase